MLAVGPSRESRSSRHPDADSRLPDGRIEVLVTSRVREALGLADALARAMPRLSVKARHISNGHADPLYGVEQLPHVVVFVQITESEQELVEYARRPAASRPPLIVLGNAGHAGAMRIAMKAGARDFLSHTAALDEIQAALAPVIAELLASRTRTTGNLIAVMNAKGGSGASLLASNIAHTLVTVQRQRTVLIDLDMQFGSPGQYLDMRPKRGLLEALQLVEELDEAAAEAYVLKHDSGLHVLCAECQEVLVPDDSMGLHLVKLLDLIARNYDQIVVDLPRHIDPLTVAVLERANHIAVITQQCLSSVRDTNRLISILTRELGVDPGRVVLIVNRFQKSGEISLADIEKTLGCQSPVTIPNDFHAVRNSLNNGIPLHDYASKAALTRAVVDIGRRLGGVPEADRSGLFAGISSLFARGA